MAAVTPGVAFDLSVNLESKAFIGSILDADVSSRHDFTLTGNRKIIIRTENINREVHDKEFRHQQAQGQSQKKKRRGEKTGIKASYPPVPVLVVLQAFGGAAGRRRRQHGVMAGPQPQRRSLSWAGVGAQLGGELVGHGRARGEDGSAVKQSRREIPAEKEENDLLSPNYYFFSYFLGEVLSSAL